MNDQNSGNIAVKRAVLLAGGLGTRLRPITENTPKCLVPIHGKPLLDYWLELLFDGGLERVLINTHWLPEPVGAHVRASPYASRIELVHEPELRGTGGTILANRKFFGDRPFLVAHSDNLTDFDLSAFVAAHVNRPAGVDVTMLTFRSDDPQSCGILELNSQSIVTAFHEKVEDPPGDLANGAVYIFEPSVVAFMEGLGKPVVDLSGEVLPHYLNKILAVKTDGYHRDIGSVESLRRAEVEFTQHLE